MASVNDLVTDTRNAARPNVARVSAPRSAGGATLNCDSLTGWPTASKVHFVTYQIDSNSDPIAGTQLDCYGIVSGNDIGSFTVVDGTDAGNSINDVVEMLPTAGWGQDLADALTNEHDRQGNHTSAAAISVGEHLYPVGSIYVNAAVATNPSALLGFGTWTAFGSGRVMVGVDAGQAEFDTLGETGGAKTHTLTTAEMPVHSHAPGGGIYNNSDGATGGTQNTVRLNAVGSQNFPATADAGSGGAHNNLQPYITVYMWKRTA